MAAAATSALPVRAGPARPVRLLRGRVVVILVLLAVWELGARFFVSPHFASPPSEMLLALPSMLATKGVPAALALSFGELVAAFAVSVAIGLPLGLLIGLSGASRRTLLPIVFLLYAIPQITLLPLIIMLSGIGPAAKIVFGVTHAVFPIIFTLAASVGEVDRTLVKFARITGASSWQVFRYVTFPYAVPSFFNGMRLAMVGAILGVLLAELYVSSAGIGFYTRLFADSFQTPKLFALVFVLAAMAVVLNEIMRRAEIRFSRWRNG